MAFVAPALLNTFGAGMFRLLIDVIDYLNCGV
jgi:hypothetical protein